MGEKSNMSVNCEEGIPIQSSQVRDKSATSSPVSSSTSSQSKEYKEHMRLLKEHAKQEKEMKKQQKKKEKELKKHKGSLPSQNVPSNNPVGNMKFFKNMVIGGGSDGGSTESNANSAANFPPYNSSRM